MKKIKEDDNITGVQSTGIIFIIYMHERNCSGHGRSQRKYISIDIVVIFMSMVEIIKQFEYTLGYRQERQLRGVPMMSVQVKYYFKLFKNMFNCFVKLSTDKIGHNRDCDFL